MNYTPIKWTGSKRVFADFILEKIGTKKISYYVEPFAGGASLGLKLMERQGINIESYTFSDTNTDLIHLWSLIQNYPDKVVDSYREYWTSINNLDSVSLRKAYYYEVRDWYNKTKDRLAFFFLLRTCYNGMVRYNQKGEFNSPYHFSRKGMHPDKVDEIINYWSSLMSMCDVKFLERDFKGLFDCSFGDDVFMFLDPPYINIKKNSLYSGNIDHDYLFDGLNNLPSNVSWALTIDGDCDLSKLENVEVLPLQSNSSFKRMKGAGSGKTTTEKLVLKI